jgi:hypothetical protein
MIDSRRKRNSMTDPISAEQERQFIQEGYLVARNLLPAKVVEATRRQLLAAMEIDPTAPETWAGKNVCADPAIIALTTPCRTEAVEAIAERLAGPHFVHWLCHSPYLESRGIAPFLVPGYIPVLNFPTPGPQRFEKPTGYHIDGMHRTTLWPDKHFLVVFAYLTDVAEYGGATTVLPGSHRQVFAHWTRAGHPGSTHPPALDYADPLPLPGNAGDVIFMHYLMVHSGSANHSDRIRVGLNTAVLPDPAQPYQRKQGVPQSNWTPLDHTLRTDNLDLEEEKQD